MPIDSSDHFFRHQYTNLVASLSRKVGVQHLSYIEDAAQTALLKAWTLWQSQVSPNPEAWLHRVSYNALLDALRKDKRLTSNLDWDSADLALGTEDADNIDKELHTDDDLLHLFFICCDPKIPQASSLVLVLKILCGFSIKEISLRLFISEANVYKRYQRARDQLKKSAAYFNTLSANDSTERLNSVLKVLYLLFSEGYLSYSQDEAIRQDLCEEAIRLTTTLLKKPLFQKPTLFALLALMHLNLARLSSRLGQCGELLLLEEQDRSLWNQNLIAQGFYFFSQSAEGDNLSRYHLEAAIAAEHCRAKSFSATNWQSICGYYQQLEAIAPSYLYRLNRCVALAEWQGAESGLALLEYEAPPTWAAQSHLWLAVSADMHRRCGNKEEARRLAQIALDCSPNDAIKTLIYRRLNAN